MITESKTDLDTLTLFITKDVSYFPHTLQLMACKKLYKNGPYFSSKVEKKIQERVLSYKLNLRWTSAIFPLSAPIQKKKHPTNK